jgi:glycogen synthase
MPLLTLYFQLHQPFRLHPDRDRFLWDEKNREVFLKVSEKCYLPATHLFTKLIREYPDFKIVFSMSGTFLEQAELYRPEVIVALRKLREAGEARNQVEFLEETYYHSLASLFGDPKKKEFREQVLLHREIMKRLFGILPLSFRNTELMYNNEIAEAAADMGYQAMLCEKRDDMFMQGDRRISPNAIFYAKGTKLIVIPRNRELSDDVAYRFPYQPITPEAYAESISIVDGEAVLLGYDYEHIGEHIWEDKGIFEFWRRLPEALSQHSNIIPANPAEIAQRFKNATCPTVDINGLATSSWADAGRDTFGWLGTMTQHGIFKDIEGMEEDAKKVGGGLLKQWRHLTTSDHVYFLHENMGEDHAVHSYFNPYGGSITQAAHVLTRKIDFLQLAVRQFQILKRREKTAVLIITSETGKLPEDMGSLARYISGKSGGQGEVVSALCEGLLERDIEVHLATLNLKKRFQREAQMSESQWRELRYRIDPDKIHLVSSAVFTNLLSAYSGNPILTAAEFQREVTNQVIKEVRAKSEGRLIIHSHDWMAGGTITAYAKSSGLPVLHTVHNVFTSHIPLETLFGVDLEDLTEYLYFSEEHGKVCIDSQATAIKNATLINFVGERFLREIVDDYFIDRPIVPYSVRLEVKEKYESGSAFSVINAPSHTLYPERCRYCVKNYGPDDAVLEAKKENRMEFQKRTGLRIDPDAVLLYWPSRLDPTQKGVEILEDIALKFCIEHADVQIAVVGSGVGNDHTHEDIVGRIAWASGGKIVFYPFNDELSLLGYAAASDVFGVSLYEPCGQIDQIGNLFGATATNRDTGGYHDKIRELRLSEDGFPQDVGNGFLFRDYDSGGLWYGLEKSVQFHRKPPEIREPQIKRIMKEAREKYDLGSMINAYIGIYERLNDGKPLV